MQTGMFTAGILTGLAGAAAAAMVINYKFAGTSAGQTVSRTAHRTAGMVGQMAQDAADTVDRFVD